MIANRRKPGTTSRSSSTRLRARSSCWTERLSFDARVNLVEQLQPFRAYAVFEWREAGHIACWPRQACDDADTDRIGDVHKHDRDRFGSLLEGNNAWAAGPRYNDVG